MLDKKKIDFEFDLGLDLNLDLDLEKDFNFHDKFAELCLRKIQKRKKKTNNPIYDDIGGIEDRQANSLINTIAMDSVDQDLEEPTETKPKKSKKKNAKKKGKKKRKKH